LVCVVNRMNGTKKFPHTLPALGLWVVAARFLRGKFTFAGATKG
jgi:hypothetical protein